MLSALLYKHAESLLLICLQRNSNIFGQIHFFPQQFAKSWQQERYTVRTSKGRFTTVMETGTKYQKGGLQGYVKHEHFVFCIIPFHIYMLSSSHLFSSLVDFSAQNHQLSVTRWKKNVLSQTFIS